MTEQGQATNEVTPQTDKDMSVEEYVLRPAIDLATIDQQTLCNTLQDAAELLDALADTLDTSNLARPLEAVLMHCALTIMHVSGLQARLDEAEDILNEYSQHDADLDTVTPD